MRRTSATKEVVLQPEPKAALPGIFFLGGFFGIWSGGFLGGLSFFALTAIGYGSLGPVIAIVIGLVAFVGTIALNYYRVKSTRYTVTTDGVESESGLLSTSITNVAFEDVTDVHYKQSMFDGLLDVGTVKLNTAGSDDKAMTLGHVDDAHTLYEELEGRVND